MSFYENSARDTFFMIMQCMNDVLKSLLYSSPSLHVQFCELAVQMMVWILVFGTARSKLVHHLRANPSITPTILREIERYRSAIGCDSFANALIRFCTVACAAKSSDSLLRLGEQT